ncbi:MAG: hypothetical protein ACRDD4_07950, partial [Culicoidibacterales bacterium]
SISFSFQKTFAPLGCFCLLSLRTSIMISLIPLPVKNFFEKTFIVFISSLFSKKAHHYCDVLVVYFK